MRNKNICFFLLFVLILHSESGLLPFLIKDWLRLIDILKRGK